MAKLYAELTSDRGTRVISRGGDNYMSCIINDGNSRILSIDYDREKNELNINNDTENMVIIVDGFQVE